MEDKVLMWVTEVEIPFHHSLVKRWQVIIVDSFGKRLMEDWNFESFEEATEQMRFWEIKHPDVRVFQPFIRPA